MQETALRELESGMRQIPGFSPRRSGIIRGRPEQMQPAPYEELVRFFLEEIPPSRLAVRMASWMKISGYGWSLPPKGWQTIIPL